MKKIFSIIMASIFSINLYAINTEYKTDVVVVGSGGAGMTAALFAAENGANVILLEKTGYLGGATLMSAGIIPAAGTKQQKDAKIDDSIENFKLDIFRAANYSQDKDMVDTVASEAKLTIEWLESLGVKFNLITNTLYYGQSNYRMHIAEGSGIDMTAKIIEAVKKNPKITVLNFTAGTGLITDKENVNGVRAKKSNGEEIEIYASKVILATSGFASNEEMLKKYIPEIINAYPLTAPGATGEGIAWGQKLGAEIKNMHAYQGHAVFNLQTKSSMDLSILSRGGILINKDGKRFTNEIMGYSELTPHVVNQKEAKAYILFNKENAEKTGNFKNYTIAGIVLEGKNIAEIAKAMNVNEKELEKTIKIYKEGIEKGEDIFNRTKLPKNFAGPYYAIEITGDLRHTQGGLVITLDGEVKKENSEKIANLYAAGGVTEGFSGAGGPNYMSGNGLLQAFVFGRRAGISAAKSITNPMDKTIINNITGFKDNRVVKDTKYKDGKYVGEGKGYKGDIKVEVTVEHNKIVQIKAVEYKDTEIIFNSAIEKISDDVVYTQNTDKIDSVAGATSSARGIGTAIKNAVKSAK